MNTIANEKINKMKEFIDIKALGAIYADNIEAVDSMFNYCKRFLQAETMIMNYNYGSPTFRLAENGVDYYERKRDLYLSKATRKLLELSTIARINGAGCIVNKKIDKSNFADCLALIEAFNQSLWDQAKIDIEDRQVDKDLVESKIDKVG